MLFLPVRIPLDNGSTSVRVFSIPSRAHADALRGSVDLLVQETLSMAADGSASTCRRCRLGAGVGPELALPRPAAARNAGLILSRQQTTQNDRRARCYEPTRARQGAHARRLKLTSLRRRSGPQQAHDPSEYAEERARLHEGAIPGKERLT